MSKSILQDPTVTNHIALTLANTQDDCFVGSCEWNDGSRPQPLMIPGEGEGA